MHITTLKLINFRNYDKLELNFGSMRNIIIGNNGVGKSNIIEAIYYLALTKSFKNSNDVDLIKKTNDFFFIETNILEYKSQNYKVSFNKNNNEKILKISNNKINKVSDYVSNIKIVLYSQEDLKLIKDNPAVHRKLINMELSQFNNEYLKLLSLYNKILKQRNYYLKSMQVNANVPKEYLDILTEKLIEIGIRVYKMRKDFIEQINKQIGNIYFKFTKNNKIHIKYVSNFENKTYKELISYYKKHLNKDINYGKTNYGIHLDDYLFYSEEENIKNFFSEGEQKSAIIAFKFAEIKYCKNILKEKPIFILDDLFSELDNTKINRILKLIYKDIQTIITTTDINSIAKDILVDSKVFKIINNRIKEK